ncbi:nickel pincer cofactor biosynthesis protein LarC [Bacteroidota bacterium]
MSILKIEAFSGLSGDMFLGALTSLTGAYDEIINLPTLLHLEKEAEIMVSDMNKNGIACKHIKIVDKSHKKDGHHSHRHLTHINEIIDKSDIPGKAKGIAREIFHLLGEAESQVHDIPIEKIHFHEVGAIDSILDIIGTAYLLEKLNIVKTYSIPVNTGFGFANTEHGKLPVPCPATQNLLLGYPTERGDIKSEMTTPTGAAILKYLNPEFEIPVLIEEKVAYGPGEKDFDIPNVLRLSLCREQESVKDIAVIQTNIDDMSAEYLGVEFQNKLFELGALDFYYQQVIMKKGRPGIVINVLTRKNQVQDIADYILKNTSSIGLRYFSADRIELDRENKEMDTSMGKVKVKESTFPDQHKRIKPESEDIIEIARKKGKSPLDVSEKIKKELE